jgi:hypothetical protein
MKKLEDLPKNVGYKVPDGYFDQLPLRIQNRLSSPVQKDWKPLQGWATRLAIPLIILVAAGSLWYQQANNSIVDQLEKIDSEQLSFFIEDPDLTSEELVENVNWTTGDLDALEQYVFNVLDESGDGLEIIIDEMELENL